MALCVVGAAALLISACAPPASERRREARASEPVISAGRYSTLSPDPAADPQGITLDLPQGSATARAGVTVFFRRYGGTAAQTRGADVRRGLSGIFFDAPYAPGGAATTFAAQPQADGTVQVIWRDETGMQTAVLRRTSAPSTQPAPSRR